MRHIRDILRLKCRRIAIYVRALAKWVLVSGIVGILCGLLGSAFPYMVPQHELPNNHVHDR